MLSKMDKLQASHKTLTTQFVRDWRAKHRDKEGSGPKQWLRRSRLVAREYATDKRDDVHAPATGGQALRSLPLLYLGKKAEEQLGGEQTILGSLDVKDAFLQVGQEVPTQVTTATGHFEVLRNLPGQRIGAKAWFDRFDHLTEWLRSRGFKFCPENPCLRKASSMCVLIHVDDIMFVGDKDNALSEFIPEMKKVFDISEQRLEEDGSSFQFLRRTYEKVENVKVHPGKYAENMVEAYESKLGRTKI